MGVKKGLLSLFLGSICGLGAVAAGPVLILDYHTFLGTKTSTLDYSDKVMGEQLDRMKAMGFQFVTLPDAIAGKTGPRLSIVLTIDDGNHSIYQAMHKVFEPRHLKPFLFIYPHAIDRSRFTITSARVHELEKEGFLFGAHGYYHLPMTEHAWRTNPEQVRHEALWPAEPLTKILGYRPTMFAYPYGFAPPAVQKLVLSAGYTWAFAADDKIVPVDFSDPHLAHGYVPRTIVYHWNLPILMRYLEHYAAEHPLKRSEHPVS